jgi:acetyl-CoA C-acetyltransferase
MTDAFIYDHVRTPRGKGKADGSLHEVTAIELGTQPLRALKERNNLDVTLVEDVVYGCVDPVGEAGADIRLWQDGAGHPDQPLLRLRP